MHQNAEARAHTAATRPSIPPLAWCAAAQWIGVCGAEEFSWRNPGQGGWVGGAALLVLLGLMLYSRTRAGARTPGAAVLLIVAGIALGLCVGSSFWARVDADAGSLRAVASGARVESVTDSVASRFGSTVRLKVLDGQARGATCTAQLPDGLAASLCGEAFVVRASLDAPGVRDDWARRRHRAGDSGRISAWSATPCAPAASLRGLVSPLRRQLVAMVQGISGDGGALLQGVLLGERSRVRKTPMESEFRTTGLSHLLAVSGTHLSIVAYLAGTLLSRTRAPRNLRIVMILALAACYVLLTGAPISSIRAFLMAITAGLSGLAGRRGDAIAALCVAVCLVLSVSPAQAFDIGFALSVSAVGGLVVFAPLASGWLALVGGSRMGRPLAGLSAPLVAQASTAPIAIPAFNMFSLIAPVANVLVLPIASIGLGVGVAGVVTLVASRSLGRWLLRVAALVLELVARIASELASVPHAAIPLGGSATYWGALCAATGAVLWALWPRPRAPRAARLLAGVLLAGALAFGIGGPPGSSACAVIVLDVGQGDAILIKDGAHAVLVDTGPDASSMRAAAARVGMRDLDAVLLTHPHADHIGGLAGLQGVVGVRRVLVPASTAQEFESISQLSESLTGAPAEGLSAGSTLSFGSWNCEVLWPIDAVQGLSCNDTSFIMRVSHTSGFSVVLTGDAESAAQQGLMRMGAGIERCEVLKVPHHGSSGGIDPEALAAWAPELALISVGADNQFGHPHSETLGQLRLAGVRVVRTDLSGDVRIDVGADGYRVNTSQGGVAHGTFSPTYATIASAGPRLKAQPPSLRIGTHGTHRSIGSQVRLPDPRGGRPALGAGHKQAQAPLRAGRGP